MHSLFYIFSPLPHYQGLKAAMWCKMKCMFLSSAFSKREGQRPSLMCFLQLSLNKNGYSDKSLCGGTHFKTRCSKNFWKSLPLLPFPRGLFPVPKYQLIDKFNLQPRAIYYTDKKRMVSSTQPWLAWGLPSSNDDSPTMAFGYWYITYYVRAILHTPVYCVGTWTAGGANNQRHTHTLPFRYVKIDVLGTEYWEKIQRMETIRGYPNGAQI